MENSRLINIEIVAGNGELIQLKNLLGSDYSDLEINTALENAIAYSRTEVASYLLSIGASLKHNDYQGVYYAIHNGEIEGLKYAILNGVDINVNSGMLLNKSIMTWLYSKEVRIINWLINQGADLSLLNDDSKRFLRKYGDNKIKSLLKID